jgi:hypothetical protein
VTLEEFADHAVDPATTRKTIAGFVAVSRIPVPI